MKLIAGAVDEEEKNSDHIATRSVKSKCAVGYSITHSRSYFVLL